MATNRRQFLKKILYGAGGVTAAGVIYSQAKIEKPQIIVDGEELKEQNHEDTDQDLNIPTQYHPVWDLLPANSKAALLKQNFVDPLQLNYTGGPGRHINSKRNVVVGDYEVTSPDLFVDDLSHDADFMNYVNAYFAKKGYKRRIV